MDIKSTLANYEGFKEKQLKDRFFKHQSIIDLLNALPADFEVTELGTSVLHKSINLVKWGNGPTKIMLWSQMHGDEATGTMALFDMFNLLQQGGPLVELIQSRCQLFIIPMVNPDGASAFTRRNAQQIDINRDYLQLATPEAKILKKCRDEINPEFGFNLHDQLTLWSVSDSLKPATLSFLAPSFDRSLNINSTRKKAMLVIADMFCEVDEYLPQQIGLFKDEYEPRAFGDNFQAAGTSTILIEAGGYAADFEKQEIRKFYFGAMLAGLISISTENYRQQQVENYLNIPKNNKEIFHILVHQVTLDGINVSIGINYDEYPAKDGQSTFKVYTIQDIGDLSFCDAYQHYDASSAQLEGDITLFKNADFKISVNHNIILSFQNGKML
jgi:hypothetical protein